MLSVPHTHDHSREILDPAIWQSFAADPAKPALVSFPRTGSHWLRILMELLFQRPTLVRAFYYFENRDYLCWHTHDDDLTFEREHVIYLHREPVATVYSQLRYIGADLADSTAVRNCTIQYCNHLVKWLLHETFTKRKLTISYHELETTPLKVLESLATFFGLPWDQTRAQEALAYVTKDVVSLKTKEHDSRVIDTRQDYQTSKEGFCAQYGPMIAQLIAETDPRLQAVVRP